MNSPAFNNFTSTSSDSIIDAYTRQDAIDDEVQICLSERFPNECQLYRHPVYYTAAVFHLIESASANNSCSENEVLPRN